jgi:hypothetical protein
MPSNTQNAVTAALPDASIERLRATWIHRLLTIAVPWAVAVVAAIGAAEGHAHWGGRGIVTIAAVVGLAAGVAVVTGAAWAVTRHRPRLLRAHSAATAATAGAWLCLAVTTGVGNGLTSSLAVLVGATLCLTWNLRPHAKTAVPGTAGAAIADLFEQATEPAGLKGAKMALGNVSGRKANALVKLVPGEQTAEDLVRRLPNIESGMKLPPGALTAAAHLDRADLARLTLSDPRLMRRPIPWPGPSNPGASIAEPICPGMYQDGDLVVLVVTGHHVQIMGMTGSAKSLGGGWNYLGEVITRYDAAVFAADVTKGDQTLGPLRIALHGLATDMPGTRALLAAMHSIVRPRTDYLASRGLQRWQRDCGLTYLIVWLEECPDILDQLTSKQMDGFISMVKAMRSAGMTVVMSLQRSTYDQMPTILRGQLANWTFGVANSADAKYGLSERQEEAGAAPERWQNTQPGMAYLDAPGIPDDRIAMPMRCYFWGEDASIMAAHAAKFPASERPLDDLTARLLASAAAAWTKTGPAPAVAAPAAGDGEDQADETDDEDDDDQADEDEATPEEVRAEYLTEPDPDPELAADIDDEAIGRTSDGEEEFASMAFPAPKRAEPAEARARFRELLTEWVNEGRQEFGTSDLYELLDAVGMSRAWLHKQINTAIEDGLIEPVTEEERGRFGRYTLLEPEPALA